MDRVSFFTEILNKCQKVIKDDPNYFPIAAAIRQLQYLIDIEQGIITNYSELEKIKIGWIAVREMDGFEDKNLIHDLCIICDEAKKMAREKGVNTKNMI